MLRKTARVTRAGANLRFCLQNEGTLPASKFAPRKAEAACRGLVQNPSASAKKTSVELFQLRFFSYIRLSASDMHFVRDMSFGRDMRCAR